MFNLGKLLGTTANVLGNNVSSKKPRSRRKKVKGKRRTVKTSRRRNRPVKRGSKRY